MRNRAILKEDSINLDDFRERTICDDTSSFVTHVEPVPEEWKGAEVKRMKVESYGNATKSNMDTIISQMVDQFDINSIVLIQSVGVLKPKDKIMAVLISSAEKKEAVEALSFCLERFEDHVPVQKKVITEESKEYWVERADDVMDLYGRVVEGMQE